MKLYSIYKDEKLAFQWDSNTGDENYYEPCFGKAGSYEVITTDITALKVQEKINQDSLEYLAKTDWYVIRQLEANVPVPQEILTARAAARLAIVK